MQKPKKKASAEKEITTRLGQSIPPAKQTAPGVISYAVGPYKVADTGRELSETKYSKPGRGAPRVWNKVRPHKAAESKFRYGKGLGADIPQGPPWPQPKVRISQKEPKPVTRNGVVYPTADSQVMAGYAKNKWPKSKGKAAGYPTAYDAAGYGG
jgi:hypothetical protein